MKFSFSILIAIPKIAYLQVAASDRASKANYKGAYIALMEIYRLYKADAPSLKVLYDTNLLLGLIASQLGNYDLAIAAIELALEQINKTKKLSDFEKNYLRYYCRTILEWCSAETAIEVFKESRRIDVSFDSLRFDKVRPALQRNFPVTRPVRSEIMPKSH